MARKKYRTIKRDVAPPRRKPLQGLTRFECSTHGFIADAVTSPATTAICPCGRIGKATISTPRSDEV